MDVVSDLIFSSPARAITRRFKNGKVSVFMLHRAAGTYPGIGGHDANRVAANLDEMRAHGIHFLSLLDVVAAIDGGPQIVGDAAAFTIDDGYSDQADVLAPIFLERGVPLTLFAVSGLIDRKLWTWDAKVNWLVRQTRLSSISLLLGSATLRFKTSTTHERNVARRELVQIYSGIGGADLPLALRALETATETEAPNGPPPEYAPTTWGRLRELEAQGLSVAPHTVTHRIVGRLDDWEVRWELEESVRRLQAELKAPVPVLAWPVGRARHFGSREITIASQSGIRIAFAAEGGYADVSSARGDESARFNLGRFPWEDSAKTMLRYSSGLEAIRERLAPGGAQERLPMWVVGADGHTPTSLKATAKDVTRKAKGIVQQAIWGRGDNLRRHLQPERIQRLVYVCKGNICRSPFAESFTIMRGWPAASFGLEVSVSQPADEEAIKVALMLGIDMTRHMSRPITQASLSAFDCLVVMEAAQLAQIRALQEQHGCQMTLLGAWRNRPVSRVPDPFSRGRREMETVLRTIEQSVDGLLAALRSHSLYRAADQD